MPLTDDRMISGISENDAFSPTMQLYFRLAASTSFYQSLKNSSSATKTSSPGLDLRRVPRSMDPLPISSPFALISQRKPLDSPSGTLKLSIWSFQTGGAYNRSSLYSVWSTSSPMVTRTLTFLSPCLRRMVALSNRKVSSVLGNSQKRTCSRTWPNFFSLSEARMSLKSWVCSAVAELMIGLASTAPQAMKVFPSKTPASMALPSALQKLLMVKLKLSFTLWFFCSSPRLLVANC